ncbi:MAG: 16S rRNA processing protein RimM [Deltaproteobacteria bacterium]|nr:MAG: 16S rRNA processing protein RimM [Deltaproteobacteria bacterium]
MVTQPSTCRLVVLGRVGRPHGVRGEVTFLPYNAESELVAEVARLRALDGRCFTVRRARRHGAGRWILALEGVVDRDAASALTHTELGVLRSELPEPEEGWYLVDLLGLRVVDGRGEDLGTVVGVEEAVAAPLLLVRRGAHTWRLPATAPLLVAVDFGAGEIEVDVPDGLVDL